ncbi:hypothetical protein lerEdw1_009347 [Lerista edwardsae]|nr:hypothetical protein lerEdw1_009347 [Lerista edwardsae]
MGSLGLEADTGLHASTCSDEDFCKFAAQFPAILAHQDKMALKASRENQEHVVYLAPGDNLAKRAMKDPLDLPGSQGQRVQLAGRDSLGNQVLTA